MKEGLAFDQLKKGLEIFIGSWKANAADPKMSKARRSISFEHANALLQLIADFNELKEDSTDIQIENLALKALSDAMLAELDRQTSMMSREL